MVLLDQHRAFLTFSIDAQIEFEMGVVHFELQQISWVHFCFLSSLYTILHFISHSKGSSLGVIKDVLRVLYGGHQIGCSVGLFSRFK